MKIRKNCNFVISKFESDENKNKYSPATYEGIVKFRHTLLVISMIMLTRSSQRIVDPMRYTGNSFLKHYVTKD